MKLSFRIATASFAVVASLLFAPVAFAQEPAAEPTPPAPTSSLTPATPPPLVEASTFPRVGGHLGFAVPIVTIADPSTVIGEDFVTVGLTPGITVKVAEKWSIDFEFIVLNELKSTPAATRYVVDPGVVYNAGPVSAGLRVASIVGAPTNIGLVPILVLPVVKVSDKLTYYIEGDVPMFLRDAGSAMKPSIGFQFQSGFAF